MSKYYFTSILIHILVIAIVIAITIREEKVEDLELVQKQMLVSVKTQRGVVNSLPVNLTINSEEKTEQKEKQKEKQKKEENNQKEQKIEKNKTEDKVNKTKKTEKTKTEKTKEVEKNRESDKNKKEAQRVYNEFTDSNRFIKGGDGIFTATSSKGIEYEIVKEIDPEYPIRAKKMGYKGTAIVKFRFLVNAKGKVEQITFLSGEKDYGFKEEAEKALKKWEFKPIIYKNKPIKVYFEKEFKYEKK